MSLRAMKLLAVCLSLAASLAVLELGFRWWRYRTLSGIPQPGYPDDITYRHPRYHHRYRANAVTTERRVDYVATYTTNAVGLRGPRDYGPKSAGVRRLLMLGDSFAFGIGVNDEQTFSVLLQDALSRRGSPVEVINAGSGSYSPVLHYLTLRDLYLPWKPDAVILWLDFGDLQDDYEYERHLVYDASGEPAVCNPDYVHGHRDWLGGLLKRSAVMKYLHHKLGTTAQKIRLLGWREYVRAKLGGEDTRLSAVHMRSARRRRVDLIAYDRYLMVRGLATAEELERYWQRTGSYILKVRDVLRERGVPLVLGLYPLGVQVSPNQWPEGRTYFLFDKERTYDDPVPFRFIEDFARAQDIPVINTYPSFVAMRQETLFLPMDGHFTPAGHQVLAAHVLRDPVFSRLLRDTEEAQMTNEPSKPNAEASWKTCPIPTDAELHRLLTPEQYAIVRQSGTERPFHNAYWNNKAPGVYVDIVTGEPLFASVKKFDSETGWPSFTEPIDKARITFVEDRGHGMVRTEVRATRSNSHLGHVFDDGPPPTGLRYCINSAALRFIPLERLDAEGYSEYRGLFSQP